MASVTPAQIYSELVSLGASTTQAIGIMANMINESRFDPEAIGDQGTSFGLVQQHGNYAYLVTGNPAADMTAQLKLLVQNGGLGAASGSTAAAAAGNFSANYEKCVGCQAGGAQYNSRVANVAQLLQDLATGKWPTSAGSGGGGGGGGSGGGGGGGLTAAQQAAGYESFLTKYPPPVQTASFLGSIFAIIEDPFQAITSSADAVADFFSSPFVGFLDVFKLLVTAASSLINGANTIIHDILWLFNPSHWIRVFCFTFGVAVTIPALYALMHTGTGDMYLAMGIALTSLAGILFFLAFHQLPFDPTHKSPASASNVITWQALLAYISEGIRTGSAPTSGTPGINTLADVTPAPAPATTVQPVANATAPFPTITPGGIIPGQGTSF
jgi:succinate dehydrogenase hydrophobic anchor subunit